MTITLDPSPIAPSVDLFPRCIGSEDNGRLMTPDEFDAVEEYDDNYRYELIKGVLIVNAAPGPEEADPNEELGFLLRLYSQNHPGVIDRTVYERYINTDRSRRRADRAIWIGLGRTVDLSRDVPAIAVEFLSAGKRSWQRDYIHKREEYLAAGVKEYWLFDRFQRQFTVFQRNAAGDTSVVIPAGSVYTTPLLPGFELPIDRLLKCADYWIEMPPDENPS